MHNSSPSPSKPGLHLHAKCAGKLQHSAFSTHLAAIDGSAHSSISEMNYIKLKLIFYLFDLKETCNLEQLIIQTIFCLFFFFNFPVLQ